VKVSRYNFAHVEEASHNSQVVIYNSRTGAMAALEPDKYADFKKFEENGICIGDTEFVEQLMYCGFLIDDDFDEINHIKASLHASRYNNSVMSLTIAPTMACNFACAYCFENGIDRNEEMSEDTMKRLVNFIEARASHLDELHITWFGGEPLLAVPQLETISRHVIEICKANNVKYTSIVVTNGYLLTQENANKLMDCAVSNVQVTIDGGKELHNSRRPLVDGSGTFERIIQNVSLAKHIIPITIRINVDNENHTCLGEVMNVFNVISIESNNLRRSKNMKILVKPADDAITPMGCVIKLPTICILFW